MNRAFVGRMKKLSVRKAEKGEKEAILRVYATARAFMRRNGNREQWTNGYPGECEIGNDIDAGNLYVGIDQDGEIAVVFAFIIGEDPTYREIDGRWLNDEPYGTIHRIGSSGKHSGMLGECVEYCLEKVPNIRIDTHRDNRPMLAALQRLEFHRCGVIICADGTPREAFQLVREREG